MISAIYFTVILLSIIITASAHSQFHFEVKRSSKDIDTQKELFKNANVKFAIITDNSGFDEKISFDREGKILERMSYQTGDEEAFDGRDIYEYDNKGNLILIRSECGDCTGSEKFFDYDENGNVIKFRFMSNEEIFFYNSDNELVSSETIEKSTIAPIESVKYQKGLIVEIIFKCWDENLYTPFIYSKVKYTFSGEQRVTEILNVKMNCKTEIEEVASEITIEYNEKSLPTKYVTTHSNGDEKTSNVSYKYYN